MMSENELTNIKPLLPMGEIAPSGESSEQTSTTPAIDPHDVIGEIFDPQSLAVTKRQMLSWFKKAS